MTDLWNVKAIENMLSAVVVINHQDWNLHLQVVICGQLNCHGKPDSGMLVYIAQDCVVVLV